MEFVLVGVILFWLGYFVGKGTVKHRTADAIPSRRVRTSFKSPLVPYAVDYSEYKNSQGMYLPIRAKG